MLLPDELFRLALLLLLMGFAGMAALNTLEVWRSRTAVVAGRKPRPFTPLERFALVLGVAGVVAMGATFAFRTALPREGVLVGRGVQTVRVPPGLQVVDLATDSEVAQDAVLARFIGADGLVEVRSIAAGVVAYRSPSPASAYGEQPLLVIAPPDGIRAVVQVPTREVEDLRAAGAVPLDLLGPRFTERRFSGRLVDAHPIDGRPSWSIAEIAGLPHSDAVSAMVSVGATPDAVPVVEVELAWSPPVLDVPLFRTGIVLALAGALLFPAARITLAARRAQEDPA